MSDAEARYKLRSQILSYLQEAEELDTMVDQLLTEFPEADPLKAYQELSDKLAALLGSYLDDLDEGRWPTI
jgi:hypothetical protein